MRTVRLSLTGAVVVALLGGMGCNENSQSDDADAAGAFAPAGSMAEGRFDHTATLLSDGRVLVVGGATADHRVSASAEVWDPATDLFEPAGSYKERVFHTATLLSDGRVFVVGDFTDFSAEIWDAATGTFSPAGSLAEPSVVHAATLLSDDRVFMVGSIGFEQISTSAEVWDPATGTFSPAGPLAEGHVALGFTATAVPDGRVLVMGGFGDTGSGRSVARRDRSPLILLRASSALASAELA